MSARQWAILLLLGLIWGSSFLFIKWGLAEMPVLSVVAGRLIFGLLFLGLALVVTRTGLPPRAMWKHLVVVGLVNNVIPWTALAWGEQYIPSGIAAMLNASTPLFTFILAVTTWGDEKITGLKVVGLVLGFAGVATVISTDFATLFSQQGNVMTVLGEVALLIMALGYAVGTIYGRRYLQGVPALQSATGQLSVAFLVVIPVTLLTGSLPPQIPSWGAIGSVAALGFFGSGMAYLLYYLLLTQVGSTRTVIVTYLLPIVAILLGWQVLGEVITQEMVIGIILILGGVILVNTKLPGFRKAPPQEVVKNT